jgi:polyhydroxyalkanoate synthesis regulator phasin
MLTSEESKNLLRDVKRRLINAHDEIMGTADYMENLLTTEAELAESREYGRVCEVLGVLEEQIAEVSNQLTKLK